MRTPPLLADFTHTRACKPFCEKSLTLPTCKKQSGYNFCIAELLLAYLIVIKNKSERTFKKKYVRICVVWNIATL